MSFPQKSVGQERYSFVFQQVRTIDALEDFASLSKTNIAFYPKQLENAVSFCIAEKLTLEESISCILEGTSFDFIKLSSGTFVIVSSPRQQKYLGKLSGIVIDKKTRLPLPGATIITQNALHHAVTNSGGYFSLASLPMGNYTLKTSFLGYESKLDSIAVSHIEADYLEIALTPTHLVLDPIIIDENESTSTSFSVEMLSQNMLLRNTSSPSAANIIQNLSTLPGVNVEDSNSHLHIQGGGAGEYELQLDGSTIFSPPSLGGLFGPFNPLALKRIKVYKAGFGAAIASETSGLISAEHKIEGGKGQTFDVQIDQQSINSYTGLTYIKPSFSTHVMASYRRSLWEVYKPASISSYLTELIKPDLFLLFNSPSTSSTNTRTAGPALQHIANALNPSPGIFYDDLHLATHIQIGIRHQIRASYYKGESSLANDATATDISLDQSVAENTPPPTRSEYIQISENYKWVNQSYQIGYQSIISKTTLLQTQFRHSRYNLDHSYGFTNTLLSTNPLSAIFNFNANPSQNTNSVSETELALQLSIAAGTNHTIDVGLNGTLSESTYQVAISNQLVPVTRFQERDSVQIVNSVFVGDNHEGQSVTFYTQDKIKLSPRSVIEIGLRGNWFSNENNLFLEPRIQFQHTINRNVNFWSAAGLYQQVIGRFDISTSNIGAIIPTLRIWIPFSATDVAPSRAYHATANFTFKHAASTVSLESFFKYYPRLLFVKQDLFEGQPASRTTNNILEEGTGVSTGISLSIAYDTNNLHVLNRGAWTYTQHKSPSRFNNRFVPVQWNAPIAFYNYVRFEATPSFAFSLSNDLRAGSLRGFKPAYYDYVKSLELGEAANSLDINNPKKHKLPVYFRTDLGLDYSFKFKAMHVALKANILNVFNIKNVDHWRIIYDLDNRAFEKQSRYKHPRSAAFSLRVRL